MITTLLILLLGVSIVTRISSRIRKAFSELESLPTSPSMPQQQEGQIEQVQEEPYFSYESVASDEDFYTASTTPAPTRVAVAAVASDGATSGERNEGFDLRQAVIYQTILHNPFWGESRQ